MSEIREDAFLGGRLRIAQPISGYRAGADPVFLAASIPAVSGDEVLELGCGAGTAFLCLMARVNGVKVTGVERDALHDRQLSSSTALLETPNPTGSRPRSSRPTSPTCPRP